MPDLHACGGDGGKGNWPGNFLPFLLSCVLAYTHIHTTYNKQTFLYIKIHITQWKRNKCIKQYKRLFSFRKNYFTFLRKTQLSILTFPPVHSLHCSSIFTIEEMCPCHEYTFLHTYTFLSFTGNHFCLFILALLKICTFLFIVRVQLMMLLKRSCCELSYYYCHCKNYAPLRRGNRSINTNTISVQQLSVSSYVWYSIMNTRSNITKIKKCVVELIIYARYQDILEIHSKHSPCIQAFSLQYYTHRLQLFLGQMKNESGQYDAT